MQLLPYLSHMPFYAGDDLWFCESSGPLEFSTHATAGSQPDVEPQKFVFQPWSIARLTAGEKTEFTVEGLAAVSPTQVFCNPIVLEGVISFVHQRTLWKAQLTDSGRLDPIKVKSQVFCGFVQGPKVVSAAPSCSGNGGTVSFEIEGQLFASLDTPFDSLVRVVPHGENGLIFTGTHAKTLKSALWTPEDGYQRITSAGSDLYKCVIRGDKVIHAKREAGFEERYLHIDPLELSPFHV